MDQSTQYDRYCKVTVGSTVIDVSSLRCRFDIHPTPNQAPAVCILRITNVRPDHATAMADPKSVGQPVIIDAGYQNNHGVIFKGDLTQGIYGRESPTDTLVTISAAGGSVAHNNATVNTTLPPGSTPQQHLNAAIQAMKPHGVTQGYIGPDLSHPVYPRAVVLWGMARDVIANIAKNKNAFTFYDKQQVQMVEKGKGKPGNTVVLNSNTGLIGMPTQTTEAVYARCLINPQIIQLGQVKIDQKDVQGGLAAFDASGSNVASLAEMQHIATDGLYTVYKIDIIGDTRGTPWYMDLALISTTQGAQGTTTLPAQYNPVAQLGPEG